MRFQPLAAGHSQKKPTLVSDAVFVWFGLFSPFYLPEINLFTPHYQHFISPGENHFHLA
jgi:hypothetical protein